MPRWFADNSLSIGRMPLVRLNYVIVVVLPDSGERYLSSILFEGIFDSEGMSR